MPFLKKKSGPPLWLERELRAERNGLRKSIFNVNGDYYEGEWKNSKKHGKGIQFWKSSNTLYSGDWVSGQRSGQGTLSVYDFERKKYCYCYVGAWKNDKKDGFGTNYYITGCQYDGEWKAGMRDGWGRMVYMDGGVYNGEWEADNRSGKGNMLFPDGSIFEGEWSADERSGFGIFKMSDGNCYKGIWKNDKRNGPGTYYFYRTGVELDGIWVKGIPRCGALEAVAKDIAPFPWPLKIPECTLMDHQAILKQASTYFLEEANRDK